MPPRVLASGPKPCGGKYMKEANIAFMKHLGGGGVVWPLCGVTQLLEVFYGIGLALDRRLEAEIIDLDFAKAFDSVCPAKLVSKLKTFGINDPLLSWFYSYLTGRRQRVVINGTCSNWADVGLGVPQGSLLGPILFLLFVNDMPNVINSATLAMFADN